MPEFDTTDASYTSIQKLRDELDRADRVNGAIIRLCCQMYKLAWEAGVDPDQPEMKNAERVLRHHRCWDETWNGTREQGPDGNDEGNRGDDQGTR